MDGAQGSMKTGAVERCSSEMFLAVGAQGQVGGGPRRKKRAGHDDM